MSLATFFSWQANSALKFGDIPADILISIYMFQGHLFFMLSWTSQASQTLFTCLNSHNRFGLTLGHIKVSLKGDG